MIPYLVSGGRCSTQRFVYFTPFPVFCTPRLVICTIRCQRNTPCPVSNTSLPRLTGAPGSVTSRLKRGGHEGLPLSGLLRSSLTWLNDNPLSGLDWQVHPAAITYHSRPDISHILTRVVHTLTRGLHTMTPVLRVAGASGSDGEVPADHGTRCDAAVLKQLSKAVALAFSTKTKSRSGRRRLQTPWRNLPMWSASLGTAQLWGLPT